MAAPMSPREIRAAGYMVTQGIPPGTRALPWSIMRLRYGPDQNPWVRVLAHYRTRREAVEALHEEMTDPDGVLREGV